MIRKILLSLFIISLSSILKAQPFVTIGTASSTSTLSGPANSTTVADRNERHMCIYSATELTTAGLGAGSSLLSIAWEKTGAAFYYSPNLTIRVWLKHSAATSFAASPTFTTETTGATLVYETTTGTIPQAAGWINFQFNTATPVFVWNGTQHLQVITEVIRPTDWTETGFNWRTISSVTNAAANASGTIAAPPATLTRTGTRPQIRLGIPTTGNDAALVGMPNPVSGPAGSQNINVQLRNTGTATLTSANIAWNINAGPITNFPWSGSLAPGAIATVTVGSNSFAGGPHTIEATVSSPNGLPDANAANNVVNKTITICSPMSGAYTINKTLPTGGTNFNSVTDFSNYLSSCGVSGNVTATITAGTGPYLEQVIFQNIPGIGPGATVTLEGNGEVMSTSAPIIQTGSNPNRHIIRLIGVQYFTINNLEIDMFPGSTGFIGIHILNSGNHITISNCDVDMGTATSTLLGAFVANSDPAGILFPGGNFDNILITGNTTNGGGYGAAVNGMAPPLLATNVVISNNVFNNFNSNGVYLRETDGAHVRDNNLDKNTTSTTNANAIQLAQNENINGRIYRNKITMTQTNGSYVGIYLFNGTGHRVYNNTISDIRSTTGTIEGIKVREASTFSEIYFNTVSLDHTTPSTGILRGFREELSNTGVILRNNIFTLTQTTSAAKNVIEMGVLTAPSAINSNNNVFLAPGGNIAFRASSATFPTPLAFPTLASWQSGSGQDGASFETDPQYQPATLIPQNGVINGQGVTIGGITTDINNVVRSNPPDPGAYEFSPPAGDAAMTNYILPAIPFCAANLPVQFELTNAGADPLNSVTINWTVNGVPQPAVNWTGPTLASGASTTVTLGTIPVAAATLYNFSATTSLPNGNPDVNPANDNFTYSGFRLGYQGTVTINGGAPVSPTNFQTFQSAADALALYGVCAPVTINVLNGPYTEQVVFNTIPGAHPTRRVTLNGNNQTLQYNPTVAADDHILQLNAVNHMTVENLTVTSLHATQGRGIHITNGSSKLAIRNNTVNVSTTNSTSIAFGIIISGENWLLDGSLSDSVVISNNIVTGGYSSIQLSGDHWTTPLTRISVIDNTVLDWYGFGVYLSYTNNAIVRGNIIRRPTRTNSGSDAVTPAGITIPAGSTGFMLEKNRIYDLHVSMPGSSTISRGIYLSGTFTAPTSGTMQNNLIYGMDNDGAQYGIQNNSVTGPINIYHNTIVLNNATAASTSNTDALRMSNTNVQTGTDVRNNIFVVTRGGLGTKRIYDVDELGTVMTCNYNITWLNAAGTQRFGDFGSNQYGTLANWQTGTGLDANSIFVDPAFVSPGTGNFAPGNGICDGSFMLTPSLGVVDDILGTVRPVNPDAGAFEVNLPPCTGATGGTIAADATVFCSAGSASLTATGYSAGAGTSYQWQSSTDNFVANVVDMPAQTNPVSATTGTINATRYYRLRVTCAAGPVVAYSNVITITVNQQASITTQPASQTVCTGNSVTFTVVASNATGYQWHNDLGPIPGATSASYTINNVTAAHAGNYSVVVSAAAPCTAVTSNAAVLTVQNSVTITTQPQSQTLCVGSNVTFTVVANGSGVLTYQWRKNGSNIPGATNASYTINNITLADAANYDVIITGTCGPVTSQTASLTVTASGSWTGLVNSDWNIAGNWCGGVPTPTTDVFIPSSAPNMPVLIGANGNARDIYIGSGGSLTVGLGANLDIYGDFLNNGVFNASSGSLTFRGANPQTVSPFVAGSLTMNGNGGILLTGNTGVNGLLVLSNGNISTNGFSLFLSNSATGSVGSHVITNNNGTVVVASLAIPNSRVVPVGANANSYSPITITANAGHVTDNIFVNVKQGVFINGTSGATYIDNVVDRTWTLTEGTPNGSNVNISFQWSGTQELPLFQRNRSYVTRHNGTAWLANPASSAPGNDPYTQTINNVTSFAPFAVRSEAIPRPVTGIYPNPVNGMLNVVLQLPADSPIIFNIFDAKGSLVKRVHAGVLSGVTRTTINVDHLASGVYVLKVSSPDNPEVLVQRFVKKNE